MMMMMMMIIIIIIIIIIIVNGNIFSLEMVKGREVRGGEVR